MKMKSVVFAMMVTMVSVGVVGCHSDGVGMGSGAVVGDENTPTPGTETGTQTSDAAFQALTVHFNGSVTPTHYEKDIVIDAKRNVSLEISKVTADKPVDGCAGDGVLSDEDYAAIAQKVQSLKLNEYQPPKAGDSLCQPVVGGAGVKVSYTGNDGKTNTFETGTCTIARELNNFLIVLEQIAEDTVSGCTEQSLTKNAAE